MKRIFVIIPTEPACQSLIGDLRQLGLADSHLHVVAGLTHRLDGFRKASIWQRSELAHGIEWGLALGAAAGLAGGWLSVAFPPAGLNLGTETLVGATVAGAVFGVLVTAVLGSQEHNHQLDRFQRAIAAGKLVLIVDAPKRMLDDIRSLLNEHHPYAQLVIPRRAVRVNR